MTPYLRCSISPCNRNIGPRCIETSEVHESI
eukprot:CAMPEP_0185268592 /NCGR_PEP_ID=MMETSP1359-20130426/37445_1 /TAXON_ID=552665 /ORGANISM="Bigelowiella longifila, Strain CCMP242" /LENGTH=30 /DNA_ID= /DNA_START= /DNA_END= /DNA_ORIENTATION=